MKCAPALRHPSHACAVFYSCVGPSTELLALISAWPGTAVASLLFRMPDQHVSHADQLLNCVWENWQRHLAGLEVDVLQGRLHTQPGPCCDGYRRCDLTTKVPSQAHNKKINKCSVTLSQMSFKRQHLMHGTLRQHRSSLPGSLGSSRTAWQRRSCRKLTDFENCKRAC